MIYTHTFLSLFYNTIFDYFQVSYQLVTHTVETPFLPQNCRSVASLF